jgi:hypothetical protein
MNKYLKVITIMLILIFSLLVWEMTPAPGELSQLKYWYWGSDGLPPERLQCAQLSDWRRDGRPIPIGGGEVMVFKYGLDYSEAKKLERCDILSSHFGLTLHYLSQ